MSSDELNKKEEAERERVELFGQLFHEYQKSSSYQGGTGVDKNIKRQISCLESQISVISKLLKKCSEAIGVDEFKRPLDIGDDSDDFDTDEEDGFDEGWEKEPGFHSLYEMLEQLQNMLEMRIHDLEENISAVSVDQIKHNDRVEDQLKMTGKITQLVLCLYSDFQKEKELGKKQFRLLKVVFIINLVFLLGVILLLL